MRVVADTGVLVSALLWEGVPYRLLAEAEKGRICLYTSPVLLEELAGVLARTKFAIRLESLGTTIDDLLAGYASLAHLILPPPILPVILEDPDDDAVLACALAAQASFIVSGDSHLLNLGRHRSIAIVSPRAFANALSSRRGNRLK